MQDRSVVLRRGGDIAEIRLNRPPKLNALNLRLLQDLNAAVDQLHDEPELRTVVIRGEGRAFCAGLDLDMMAEQGMPDDFFPLQERAFASLERLGAIVIAQIHGHCLGGGLQLALACDIRVASEGAVLGLPAALEGLPPGVSAWRLPRFVGIGRAMRLAISGEHVGAQEALTMGLVDYVLPDEGFAEAAHTIAAQYASAPHRAAVGIKETVRSAFDVKLDTAYQRTSEVIAECLRGPDVAKAKQAWQARQAKSR
ncbi:MAG: enoyl-CoA hydratase/isomerase family protein [Micromonosporaceae bacterium]